MVKQLYVCIDYREPNNSVSVNIFSNKNAYVWSKYNQTYLTVDGMDYPAQYTSDDINKIKEYVTVINMAYKALRVNFHNE